MFNVAAFELGRGAGTRPIRACFSCGRGLLVIGCARIKSLCASVLLIHSSLRVRNMVSCSSQACISSRSVYFSVFGTVPYVCFAGKYPWQSQVIKGSWAYSKTVRRFLSQIECLPFLYRLCAHALMFFSDDWHILISSVILTSQGCNDVSLRYNRTSSSGSQCLSMGFLRPSTVATCPPKQRN